MRSLGSAKRFTNGFRFRPSLIGIASRSASATFAILRVEFADRLDVAGGRPFGVKVRGEIDVDDGLRQLRTDHPGAHGDNLRVVGFRGAFGRIGVVRERRANARHFVGRNGDAYSRAAEEDSPLVLALFDGPGDSVRHVGVKARSAEVRYDEVGALRRRKVRRKHRTIERKDSWP